ncbi:hypothetical protein GPECTOR_22g858 [Gonium pectorale]|uniref:Serine/threonine-protein phosphatase n=1 Tax=Gonium pectorale TaxID=33097 RepID=A0A150GI11_GONPE|nr:hypothetical protein GPECTOR_22g858 [Gonium pectorale]|eukprot:KXZ49265.1 hypothetical protein GPECTOR_22g858 [Gonium pectorale]
MEQEDTLLYVSAPCRVVSDLHGQYVDLMRMFGWHGTPDGSIPFVFIGDFVDRTPYGCEVLLLLYALKIKWPHKILLLRGNHEIASTNEVYGFKEELTSKWGLGRGEVLFERFNESFMYLPLAAVAAPPGYEGEPDDDPECNRFVPCRYLLVHGGIGRVETLAQIAAAKRPIRGGGFTPEDMILSELVWSDPAPDDMRGDALNKRDGYAGHIISYGADRVHQFCEINNITAVLRGHEVIQEGFELAFGGRVVTFFSAVNYGGQGSNHGCILHIALTNYEDGMPSLEVQPIRLEAVKVPPRQPASIPSDDEDLTEDLADVDSDPSSPEQPKTDHFALLSHYCEGAEDDDLLESRDSGDADAADSGSAPYELEDALRNCPQLTAAYGSATHSRPEGMDEDEGGGVSPRQSSLDELMLAVSHATTEDTNMSDAQPPEDPVSAEASGTTANGSCMLPAPAPIPAKAFSSLGERPRHKAPPPGFSNSSWGFGGAACATHPKDDNKDQQSPRQRQEEGYPEQDAGTAGSAVLACDNSTKDAQRHDARIHPKTKKAVHKYDLPTPPRPSRDAGKLGGGDP